MNLILFFFWFLFCCGCVAEWKEKSPLLFVLSCAIQNGKSFDRKANKIYGIQYENRERKATETENMRPKKTDEIDDDVRRHRIDYGTIQKKTMKDWREWEGIGREKTKQKRKNACEMKSNERDTKRGEKNSRISVTKSNQSKFYYGFFRVIFLSPLSGLLWLPLSTETVSLCSMASNQIASHSELRYAYVYVRCLHMNSCVAECSIILKEI